MVVQQFRRAHAEIFNVLADAVDEPLVGRVLSSGAGLAYDLMIAAGCAADGMITSSRQRLLAHLNGGDSEGATFEMEKHLRVLHYMGSLANCAAHRTSA